MSAIALSIYLSGCGESLVDPTEGTSTLLDCRLDAGVLVLAPGGAFNQVAYSVLQISG